MLGRGFTGNAPTVVPSHARQGFPGNASAEHGSALPKAKRPALRAVSSIQVLAGDDAGKQHRADPVVVQEGLEAGLTFSVAAQPEFVHHQRHCHADAGPVRPAQTRALSDQRHRSEEQRVQDALDDQVQIAEQDGGGMRTDLQVIVAVDHGVPGVIGGGPEDVGGIQHPAQWRYLALDGGEGHRDAPAKGHAQVHLRQMCVALQVGIAGGQEHTDEAQADGQGVQGQDQRECDQHQAGEQHQRRAAGDCAGGQWSVLGAFDVRVQPAIGVVIDHAAGRAGQPDAGAEHEQYPQRRQAIGGQPQRPPGGPQQQQGADRAVGAHQFPVVPEPRRASCGGRCSWETAHAQRLPAGQVFPPNYSNPKVGADLRPLLPLECASARLSRPEHNAPVAQPDRVVASEAIGRGFESLRARQIEVRACLRMSKTPEKSGVFLYPRSNQVRGHLLQSKSSGGKFGGILPPKSGHAPNGSE